MDKLEKVIATVNKAMQDKLNFKFTVSFISYANNLLNHQAVPKFYYSMVYKSYHCQGVTFLLAKIVDEIVFFILRKKNVEFTWCARQLKAND